MKKIFIGIIAIAFSATTFAQKKTAFVFHTGGNMSNFRGDDANYFITEDLKWTPGYQIGFSMNFGHFFSVEPGLFLIHKGTQIKNKKYNNKRIEKAIINLNYLQMPINAKLRFTIKNVGFAIGAGIYGGLGLFGNEKYTVKDKSSDVKVKSMSRTQIKFSGKIPKTSTYNYYPLDLGGQIFLGLNVKRFGITVGYQHGIAFVVYANQYMPEKLSVFNKSFYLNLSFAL